MRKLTNKEMSNVAGGIWQTFVADDGRLAWVVTAKSVFKFGEYFYHASSVTDETGSVIFDGHQGEFKNSTGNTCFVTPCGNEGNFYTYHYLLV